LGALGGLSYFRAEMLSNDFPHVREKSRMQTVSEFQNKNEAHAMSECMGFFGLNANEDLHYKYSLNSAENQFRQDLSGFNRTAKVMAQTLTKASCRSDLLP
jgi:hypothetical protein